MAIPVRRSFEPREEEAGSGRKEGGASGGKHAHGHVAVVREMGHKLSRVKWVSERCPYDLMP